MRYAIALLLLAGCAQFDYARDVVPSPMLSKGSTQGEVTIIYRMGDAEFVERMCGRPGVITHGCAILDRAAGRCVMFIQQPKDFGDVDRLALAGHELLHCFGARHQ